VAAGDRATAYALDVVRGQVVAGPHVRNACRRHLDDLVLGPERGLWWDLGEAKATWSWWESVLKLSEGQFEGEPFLLHPSQAFRVGCIFGWKKWRTGPGWEGWYRRFRRFYDEEGKGNGKSPLAGGIGLKLLTADGEPGAQVYAAGSKKEQAGILFADAVKMVKKSPALRRRLKFSGGDTKEYNIAHLKSGSFFRPISRDSGKKGSGPRPHGALADEVHEHPDRLTVEMLERGFKFRRQPLLGMFTNSGSDRNSYCYEEHEHAVRVAAGTRTPDEAFAYVGEVLDDDTFSYVCSLDPGDDPLNDPSCWAKPNPLLDTILSREFLAGVVKQARDTPGKRNGILRLHFCVWTDAETAWLGREQLEAVLSDFDPEIHRDAEVSSGLDLSGTRDLTAMAHVVETGTMEIEGADGQLVSLPTYDAWIEAWTPADTLAERALADSAPYEVWVQKGDLRTTPGERIRFDIVAAYYAGFVAEHKARALAYDRYAYDRFREELDDLGVKVLQVAHPQGGKRRARPAPEQVEWAKAQKPPVSPDNLGLWMPGSLEALEAAIVEKRIRIRRNACLVSAIMSAAIDDSDAFGNRFFVKSKSTQRIDPLISLCQAIGAAIAPGLAPKTSVYDSRGIRRL
jgi:phage terminase large subunit-like protein